MRPLFLASFLCLLAFESSAAGIRTFADLKAESWRLGMSYARSQLSSHPQQSVTPSDAEARLFYQLPLDERAVYIAYLFTVTPPEQFDGERSESMHILLTRQSAWDPRVPADPAYTAELFSMLNAYSEKQLRSFAVYVGGDAAQFHKNLQLWQAIIQRDTKRSN
jgi:hypothetical protein